MADEHRTNGPHEGKGTARAPLVRLLDALRELSLARPDDEVARKAAVVVQAMLPGLLVETLPSPDPKVAARETEALRQQRAEDVAAVERAYRAVRFESVAPEGGKIRDALSLLETYVLPRVHRIGSEQAALLLLSGLRRIDEDFGKADPALVRTLLESYAPKKTKGKVTLSGIVGRLMHETGAFGRSATIDAAVNRVDRARRVGIAAPKKVRRTRKRRPKK